MAAVIDGIKLCTRCNLPKPVEAFGKDKQAADGIRHYCRLCNTEMQRDYRIRQIQADPEAWRAHNLVINRRHSYGIEPEDYDRMYDLQLGRCAICLMALTEVRRVCIDHDHVTGEVRGILCDLCNNALGRFKDNPDSLRRAASYLEAGGSH